jgi:hypothetical protein
MMKKSAARPIIALSSLGLAMLPGASGASGARGVDEIRAESGPAAVERATPIDFGPQTAPGPRADAPVRVRSAQLRLGAAGYSNVSLVHRSSNQKGTP